MLPAGFSDVLVANVSSPTALAFTPDGRLLVTRQSGRLWVYRDGARQLTLALDLSASVCANIERGLLGVAADPAFAANHFVYLYYTLKRSGPCERDRSAAPVFPINRVARFALADDDVVDPASQRVLVDNILSPAGAHNGGGLRFGPDGYLYVGVGDGSCKLETPTQGRCGPQNENARTLSVLPGKLLRVRKEDGEAPPDNPLANAPSVRRCGDPAGVPDGTGPCAEIFAWGLRNPFRFAFSPGTGELYINDVGDDAWEEIDAGQAGADYGWNVREGPCPTGTVTECDAPPAGMTNPIYAYRHHSGCIAISGGVFVPPGVWPATYDGAYLFGDFGCGTIYRLVPIAGGGVAASEFATGLGTGNTVVDMIFGPLGASEALYYTTYAGAGQVRRITHH